MISPLPGAGPTEKVTVSPANTGEGENVGVVMSGAGSATVTFTTLGAVVPPGPVAVTVAVYEPDVA